MIHGMKASRATILDNKKPQQQREGRRLSSLSCLRKGNRRTNRIFGILGSPTSPHFLNGISDGAATTHSSICKGAWRCGNRQHCRNRVFIRGYCAHSKREDRRSMYSDVRLEKWGGSGRG